MLRIHIAIATIGRPALLRETVDLIARQTRLPDGVLIVAPSEEDFGTAAESAVRPDFALSPKGLCRQRNRAPDLLAGRPEIVLFTDEQLVMAPAYVPAIAMPLPPDPGSTGITG